MGYSAPCDAHITVVQIIMYRIMIYRTEIHSRSSQNENEPSSLSCRAPQSAVYYTPFVFDQSVPTPALIDTH